MRKKVFTPKGVNPALWRAHKMAQRAEAHRIKDSQLEKVLPVLTAKPEERPEGLPERSNITWPGKDGNLVHGPGDPAKQGNKHAKPKTAPGDVDRFDEAYKVMKTIDVTAFNFHSEKHFTWWLERAILAAEFECVGLAWCYQNGSYDLQLSPETIKRYVVKYTAERAPFCSRDGLLFLRERNIDDGKH